MKVLFVGHEDRLRAPLAAALARRHAGPQGLDAQSAGTHGEPGRRALLPEDPAEDVDLSAHRSRVLDAGLVAWADLLVALESDQKAEMGRLGGSGRCRMLSEYGAPTDLDPGDPIPRADPSDPRAWRLCRTQIAACVEALVHELDCGSQEVYAESIERLFRERTGGTLSLAPADWAAIDRWWEAGVPLWIVLDTLRETMRRTGRRGTAGRMRRLGYCEPSVKERHDAWLRTHETRPAEPPAAPAHGAAREPAVARLRAAAQRIGGTGPAALAELMRRTADDLAARPPLDDPSGELLLVQNADEDLGRLLRETVERDLIETLRQGAEEQLAPHRGRMAPEAFRATVEHLTDRLLRSKLGVPDLST
jgi:protein-tyrosine-phosphatase